MYENWKAGSSTAISSHTVFVYIKKPRKSKVKWLEFVTEFSRGTVFEINIQKSMAFLRTRNEQ